jgi:hypothetical protein
MAAIEVMFWSTGEIGWFEYLVLTSNKHSLDDTSLHPQPLLSLLDLQVRFAESMIPG